MKNYGTYKKENEISINTAKDARKNYNLMRSNVLNKMYLL